MGARGKEEEEKGEGIYYPWLMVVVVMQMAHRRGRAPSWHADDGEKQEDEEESPKE